MRSRYTAYTQANIDYIVHTMKSPAADHFDIESARQWAQDASWLNLEVIKTQTEGSKGFVEFIANFIYQKQKQQIHELSEFHFDNGK